MAQSFLELQKWVERQYPPLGVDANGQTIYPAISIRPYSIFVGQTAPSFNAIAQNASQTAIAIVQANADFLLCNISHQVLAPATAITFATDPVAQARLLISGTGSLDQFSNVAINLHGYASSQHGWNELPYPRWINARSSVSVQLTNLAAAALTCDIVLHGLLVQVTDSPSRLT